MRYEFLQVNYSMMEGDGFEDGVCDVYVVDVSCALSAAAEDGFYDDVVAEFFEGF